MNKLFPPPPPILTQTIVFRVVTSIWRCSCIFMCPYPPKVQARPPRYQSLGSRGGRGERVLLGAVGVPKCGSVWNQHPIHTSWVAKCGSVWNQHPIHTSWVPKCGSVWNQHPIHTSWVPKCGSVWNQHPIHTSWVPKCGSVWNQHPIHTSWVPKCGSVWNQHPIHTSWVPKCGSVWNQHPIHTSWVPKCGSVWNQHPIHTSWLAKSGPFCRLTAAGCLATVFGPPPPPPAAIFAGLGAARKTGPLPVLAPPNHPWREWLLLPLLPPLPPPVSINECDRAPATIKGSPNLGQFAHGHQHHPPRCVEMGGGGGDTLHYMHVGVSRWSDWNNGPVDPRFSVCGHCCAVLQISLSDQWLCTKYVCYIRLARVCVVSFELC